MDSSRAVLQLLCLLCVLHVCLSISNFGIVVPESPVLEIGKEFTATCVLSQNGREQTGATSDNIFWKLGNMMVDRRHYTKINDSAVSVTLTVTRDLANPLKCNVWTPMSPKNIHGIFFTVGYRPEKPSDLTCKVGQEGKMESPIMACTWDPGAVDPILETTYTLYALTYYEPKSYTAKAERSRGQINFGTMPLYLMVNVSVKVSNPLGTVESEILMVDPIDILQLNPPEDIKFTSEKPFPTTLVVQWRSPVYLGLLKPKYVIRYCAAGSSAWTEVPESDTIPSTESFRLQNLQPFTDYVVQMRCMNINGHGYWSEWSRNVTARTAEDKPSSKPDLWRVINPEGNFKKQVKLMWKDPVNCNGVILGYKMTLRRGGKEIKALKLSNQREFDYVLSGDEDDLDGTVTAYNSVGDSPTAALRLNKEGRPVESVNWTSQDGQLWVMWRPQRARPAATEFVIEWVSVCDGKSDWQREPGHARRAVIKGNLEPFKMYNISVYPVYGTIPGKPYMVQVYLQQDAPSLGPTVKVVELRKHSALLQWYEVPLDNRNGFITSYTIFYRVGNNETGVEVNPNTHLYKLDSVSKSTKYVVWVMASTIAGSKNGTELTFSTPKYGEGEMEAIVVGVCISFLFLTVLAVAFCINKKTMIKKHIWPHIPDPSNSTIATWSPEFPSRPETPKEESLTDVSILEVDIFDKKSMGEEDKASPHLKKYVSDEHSSGIGGSSGLSSPRQSVSDCDSADSAQTTGSTVQYSLVVNSGYKGQTPGSMPPAFARSESTQPLLDCEERPDEPHGHDSGGNPAGRRYPGRPDLRRPWVAGGDGSSTQTEPGERSSSLLNFCPVEDESQEAAGVTEGVLTEAREGISVCYMPQASPYRPQ